MTDFFFNSVVKLRIINATTGLHEKQLEEGRCNLSRGVECKRVWV